MKSLPRLTLCSMLAALVVLSLAEAGHAQPVSRFTLELEAGPWWQTVNDVQIPNRSGATRFSLADLAGEGPEPAWRGYLSWRFNDRHSLRGLYAPLSLTESAVPANDLRFNGDSFVGDRELAATYKFNSYRLTYSYLWHEGRSWRWHIGLTAKIRDAKIQLRQGNVDSTKDDVGFVPLLHIAGRYSLAEAWYLRLDLDALAGGPGRAEDVALKLGWRSGTRVAWEIGYRTVEGGADVSEVYNFAWLHYAVASIRVSL